MSKVRLYLNNRLDNAADWDADELADMFTQAVVSGHIHTPGGSVEYALAWWLSAPNGMNSTWDPDDWPKLQLALEHLLTSDDELREAVTRWVWGEE